MRCSPCSFVCLAVGILAAGLEAGSAARAETVQIQASGAARSRGAIEIACGSNLCRQSGDPSAMAEGCQIECPSGSTVMAVCTTFGDNGREVTSLTADSVQLATEGDSNALHSRFTLHTSVAVTCAFAG